MEGPASASPGLRQIVSRAPANSACRGRDPRPRLYAGGSVAPAWRPHVLLPGSRQDQPAAAAAAACASPRPRFGEPHHSTSLLGRRRRPTGGGSDGGGGGRGGGRGGGGAAATASTARAAYGHWALGISGGARHWALGLGHRNSGNGTGWAHCVKSNAWFRGRARAPRVESQRHSLAVAVLPPRRACEGRCYSPLTRRRHSSAAHEPSCLPQ